MRSLLVQGVWGEEGLPQGSADSRARGETENDWAGNKHFQQMKAKRRNHLVYTS